MNGFFPTALAIEKIIFILVIAGVFIPRLFLLDSFFVQDEHVWLNRAHLYGRAWAENNWEAMAEPQLSNHPGVTLMTITAPVVSQSIKTIAIRDVPLFAVYRIPQQ